MKIKAVVFDFDGVIVETDLLNYKVFRKLFKKYKLPFDKNIYRKLFFGKRLDECVIRYFSLFDRSTEVESFIKEKIEIFDNLYHDNIEIFEDSLKLLEHLIGKVPLGVATGTRKRPLSIAFEKYNLEKYFQSYITAEDYSKGKPDPEPYIVIASKLHIKPEDMLVIEDSPVGVESAITSGAYCIGVTHTHNKKELVKSHMIVSSLEELIDNFNYG